MTDAPLGLIFDVQRFSVHDGPGLRTTVFFKGCPLRCRWCQNPESLAARPELAHWADRCRKCGACRDACPRDAIGKRGAHVNRERCDACGACVAVCPGEALRVAGRSVAVADLVREAVRDRPFFEASGGGVTLSGGEPTLQMGFMADVARGLRQERVSVGLQTCGLFRWEAFEPHLDLFDFVHFDLKIMDPSRHREATGAENRAVLENAAALLERAAPVLFRMPIVPGHTDGDPNLRAVAAFLRGLGVQRITLLRYHAMGEAKLGRLGSALEPLGLRGSPRIAASLDAAAALMAAEGMEVVR
jgi:pyruvate formate lyase activating enzyme